MPGENYWDWSTTAASNGTADSGIDWAEGMARAAVNNSSRSELAAHAKHRDLTNGSKTTGGTANAQSLTTGMVFDTVPTGMRVFVKLGATNTGSATLNMDGIGAVTIKDLNGNNLIGGELFATSYADLLYDGTNWLLLRGRQGPTLLSTATASASASLTFTSGITAAFSVYEFLIMSLVPATSGSDLNLLVSLDAGATWKFGASDYQWNNWSVAANGTSGATGDTADTEIYLASNTSNSSAHGINGVVRLFNPAGTVQLKSIIGDLDYISSTAVDIRTLSSGRYTGSGSAITGIQFVMSSGNITSGTIRMYGVR